MPMDTATPKTTVPFKGPKKGPMAAAQLACGAGLAAFALTFTSFNSETLVATGFEKAFAALHTPADKVSGRAYDGIAGSEEFWLRSRANAHLIKAVAVGQHITLAANGTERHLTITSVADADDAITHIQTSPHRALLVTCREGDAVSGREIYFRLDANQITELPTAPVASQRAL